MLRLIVICFLPATLAFAQPGPVNPKPLNLDFSEGPTGGVPSGWTMPAPALDAGYSAQLRRQVCPEGFSACVLFEPPPVLGVVRDAVLGQTFAAAPFIGKEIRFGAWLGTLGIGGGDMEVRMRIDRNGGNVEFFDSPNGPVASQGPQWREVSASVPADAEFISISARFHPLGPAWISEPVFDEVRNSPGSRSDNEAIYSLISRFAGFRNSHDGNAVALLYSENGEYLGPTGQKPVRGRAALAALWGNLPGQVKRTLQSISFPAPNIAAVSVATQYWDPIGRHNETFVLVKEEDGAWRIRIHQTLD